MAAVYALMAAVCKKYQEFGKGLDFYQRAMDIEVQSLGPWDPQAARTYGFMGIIRLYQG